LIRKTLILLMPEIPVHAVPVTCNEISFFALFAKLPGLARPTAA